jgi:DNA-binding MarR family transcriptional regulator
MGPHTNQAGTPARDVLDSLRRIVRALRESSRRAEQQLGITGAQLFVLEKLAAARALSLNELAERTHTHQSSVSTVVTRLVERGLVRRQRSSSDGRKLELVLSARGRRLTAKTPGAAQERLVDAIQRLPSPSRRRLATLLAEVARGLDALEGRPRMFFDDGRASRTTRTKRNL